MIKGLAALIVILFSATTFANDSTRDTDAIYFPKNYSVKAPSTEDLRPLVVLLHGFKVSGNFQKRYFGLKQRMEKEGFILYVPGATHDLRGNRFWNATDYCCNHDDLPVDDVGYLTSSVQAIIKNNRVDPKRVYLIGHSNGSFMLQRLICDHADLFAGAVSLAGAGMRDLTQCKPTSPVSLLEIHAEDDKIVYYDGMTEQSLQHRLEKKELYPYSQHSELVRYPSALETMQFWARKNGCDPANFMKEPSRNYSMYVLGKETTKIKWETGCAGGTSVEFWSLSKGGHVPMFNSAFKDDVVSFLMKQKKSFF